MGGAWPRAPAQRSRPVSSCHHVPGEKPLGSRDTSLEDGATEQSGVSAALLRGGQGPSCPKSRVLRMTAVAGGGETEGAGRPGPEASRPPVPSSGAEPVSTSFL